MTAHPVPDEPAAGASPGSDNPCTRCGACCTGFRVDFDRTELHSEGGCVPDGLALHLTAGLCRLRGTDQALPRCAALVGAVGQQVRCAIHPCRPSPCRDFGPLAPFGIGDEACARARARHGLPPLPLCGAAVGRSPLGGVAG